MSLPGLALLLGVVEGLTEFLPISSTGHLILVSHLASFTGKRAEVFEVFIQLGAILAVVWEYRRTLSGLARGMVRSGPERRFVACLALAFLPSAVLGLAVHRYVSAHLFRPIPVAVALVTGAVAILLVERRRPDARTHEATAVGSRQALLVGLSQCAALWPGFSRSAATILGGMLVGLDRRAATEFSFFLAIPTMFAATLYDLAKHHASLEAGDALWLAVSFATSFVVALLAIRWLLRFVASRDLRPFAWYRIALGAAVLLAWQVG